MTDFVSPAEREARPLTLPITIEHIQRLLPHRYPFLLLDRVTAFEPRQHITALKNVTANEPFFAGHFPSRPVMPAVLLLEAMAQAGALMIMLELPAPEEKLIFFTGVDQARFRRPVVPGDQLRLEVSVLAWRSTAGRMSGQAWVEDRLAAEAVLGCHVVNRQP